MADSYKDIGESATPFVDPNTALLVGNRGTLFPVGRGKPQVFSNEENEVLREALRSLKKARGVTQAVMGRLLGVEQQTIGNLIGRRDVGMSRPVANALARELGFRDHEELLLEKGVLAAMRAVPTGKVWGNRDSAVRISQLLSPPYDRAAVDAVVSRYAGGNDRTRPVKWWLTKFGEEERELAAQRAEEARLSPMPPAPASEAKLPSHRKRQRAR